MLHLKPPHCSARNPQTELMKLEEAGYRAQDKAAATLEAVEREAADRECTFQAARQEEAAAA